MTTFKAISWAFSLQDIEPESKLLAIYLASIVDQDGVAIVSLASAAKWCGFLSPSRQMPRVMRVQASLQEIPGIVFECNEECGVVRVEMEVQL